MVIIQLAVYWDTNSPLKNSHMHVIRHSPQHMNIFLQRACEELKLDPTILNLLLPKVWVFCINPFETLFSTLDPHADDPEMTAAPLQFTTFNAMVFQPPLFKLQAWRDDLTADQNLQPYKVQLLNSNEGHCTMCLSNPDTFGLKNSMDEPANTAKVLQMIKKLHQLLVQEEEEV